MKRQLLFFLAFCFCASAVFAQTGSDLSNLAKIEAGDNYFGRSIQLGYSRKLIDHVWGNIGIETGSFFFQDNSGSTFFVFENNSALNYNVGLNIKDMDTFFLSFCLSEKGIFRPFNSLGVGLTYFDLTVNVSENTDDSSTPYQGQKDISAFALYAELHLLDFYPPNDQLAFSLGVKCNTAFLSSPQTIVTRDSAGNKIFASEVSADGGPIMFPYPELFLSVGRFF